MSAQPGRAPFEGLQLDYPMSIGLFDTYPQAQKAVDTLSDKNFPVQNCLIVGTELRQLERVTGRLTWRRVIVGGLLSGLWLGLFIGLVFSLFVNDVDLFSLVLSTMLYGAGFGAVWATMGYAFTRGRRDFTSVSRIVPGKYEVLAEHKVAADAREILRSAGLIAPAPYAAPPVPPPGFAPGTSSPDGPAAP